MEVHVRVPLEKEVPLTAVLQEPKLLEEKPEFPELTEVRPVGPVRGNYTRTVFKRNCGPRCDRSTRSLLVLLWSHQKMEAEVSGALRGGSSHDVLSEGFGLRLTRKDLQTLSNLNWLNDEVSPR